MSLQRPGILTNNSLKESEEELSAEEWIAKKAGVVIRNLGSIQPGEGWISMVYGKPKTGKTYFAGTAGPRTLYLNTGDGIETLLSPAFINRYPEAKNMIIVDIREDGGELAAYDKISRVVGYALDKLRDRFDNIVLDDATSWIWMTMGLAMDNNTQERTQGKARALRKDQFVKTELSDYNIEMQMTTDWLRRWISVFKREGINFLLLAHERNIYGKPTRQGGEQPHLRTLPGFTGQSRPDEVPAFFDDVFHSEVVGGGQTYRLDTRGSDKILAGTRHGGIFHAVEADPNFLKMLERIRAANPVVARKINK